MSDLRRRNAGGLPWECYGYCMDTAGGKIKKPRNTKGAELLERNEEMPFWWMYYYVNAKRCEKCGLILTR